MWLPFENDNSSPSPGLQRSGNNTPRRKPPPFSPLRHGDNGSQPNDSAMPTMLTDPALVQAGFFGAEQAMSSLSHSLIQPSTGVLPVRPRGKERCGSGTCSRQATVSWSKGMCKTCCIRDSTSTCFYKGHNGGLCPVSTSDGPFHLPRPIPSIPLLLPTSTSISKPGSSSFLLRFSPLTRRWLSFLVPQAFLLLILQKQKLTRSTLENLSHLGLLQIGINTDKNEKFDNNPRLRVPRTNGVLSTLFFLSLTRRTQPTRYHYLCRISKRGRR